MGLLKSTFASLVAECSAIGVNVAAIPLCTVVSKLITDRDFFPGGINLQLQIQNRAASRINCHSNPPFIRLVTSLSFSLMGVSIFTTTGLSGSFTRPPPPPKKKAEVSTPQKTVLSTTDGELVAQGVLELN